MKLFNVLFLLTLLLAFNANSEIFKYQEYYNKKLGPLYTIPEKSAVIVENKQSVETGGGEVKKGGICYVVEVGVLEQVKFKNKKVLVRYHADDNELSGTFDDEGITFYPCPSGTIFYMDKKTLHSFKKYKRDKAVKKPKKLKVLED